MNLFNDVSNPLKLLLQHLHCVIVVFYKNAFLKAMPVILPTEELNFGSMSNEAFSAYLYQLVGLSEEEINMIENAQYSQA